jgi:lipopolysaccharide transport system ATP-binding protein
MSEVAIRAEALGKRYRIGRRERYYTLRDTVAGVVSAPFRRLLGNGQTSAFNSISQSAMCASQSEFIWALKEVSFEIKQGEVVGIIGRNGAGKSTLLKILSRITEPSEGEARIYGRVGSLLEVGTGFHPELTGRENIYLNGAILGMREREINRKFDEIVAFAEIEKFLNTPVKHYSSGMYMRLAFSVAAHLEPEILLVDEVLAVGDAAFQKKCLGKMGDVARGGRTVVFVSHNMRAVRRLCERSVWLNDGKVAAVGRSEELVEEYLKNVPLAQTSTEIATMIGQLPKDPAFRLEAVEVCQHGKPVHSVLNGQPVKIQIIYTVLQRTTGLRVYFDLIDDDQNILIRTFHDDQAEAIPTVETGEYISAATVPANFLAPRKYEVRIHAGIFNVRSCTNGGIGIPLTVEASGSVNRGYPHDTVRSKLQPQIPWHTTRRE